MSNVQVLCPNKRRIPIKVNPGTTLQQVLDEACRKQGFDPGKYCLEFHGKLLDLSLSFRLSGIPNNATLETSERKDEEGASFIKDKEVQIALQLPDGSRKIGNHTLGSSLWDILISENLLDGVDPAVFPVFQYLSQEYVGEPVLKSTTLESMGIRNKVLIRFLLKKLSQEKADEIASQLVASNEKEAKLTEIYAKKRAENDEREQLEAERAKQWEEIRAKEEVERQREEAKKLPVDPPQQVIEPPPPAETPRQVPSRLAALQSLLEDVDKSIVSGDDIPWDFDLANRASSSRRDERIVERARDVANIQDFSDFKFPEATKGVDLRSMRETEQGGSIAGSAAKKVCVDRQVVVYTPEETTSNVVKEEESSEDFFQLTAQDVRKMQQLLSEEIRNEQNRAFVPRNFIQQKNMGRKVEAWKKSVLRFVFPDKSILQAGFYSTETGNEVYDFIARNLNSNLKVGPNDFVLFEPPNVQLKDLTKNLIEVSLAPAATLFFRLTGSSKGAITNYFSDTLRRVSADEAQAVAKEILSGNEVYTPWNPTVPDQRGPVLPSASSVDYTRTNRNPQQAKEQPKWLKGKK